MVKSRLDSSCKHRSDEYALRIDYRSVSFLTFFPSICGIPTFPALSLVGLVRKQRLAAILGGGWSIYRVNYVYMLLKWETRRILRLYTQLKPYHIRAHSTTLPKYQLRSIHTITSSSSQRQTLVSTTCIESVVCMTSSKHVVDTKVWRWDDDDVIVCIDRYAWVGFYLYR